MSSEPMKFAVLRRDFFTFASDMHYSFDQKDNFPFVDWWQIFLKDAALKITSQKIVSRV
jgi:hypothetical protein